MSTEKNLYQRINAVMLEVKSVVKNLTISISDTRSYKGVSHDDVTSLLRTPIANNGLVIQTSVIDSKLETSEKEKDYKGTKTITREHMASVLVEITAINMDKPEERLSIKMPAVAFDNGDKAFGKAISMATKYGLLKLFMLESLDKEEEIPQAKKTLLEGKGGKSLNRVPPSDRPAKADADYLVKVGKFSGKRLGEIDAAELANYCVYMGKSDVNGPMKEFIDKARLYISGAN